MAMDDLFKAMNMFSDSMQQLAITHGINDAQQQVQQMNSSMTDEMQKRNAQEQVARQLALQMVGQGANAQQVQQANAAIMPQAINNANDMYTQGVLKGDQGMQQTAGKMQGFEMQPEVTKLGIQGQTAKDVANITGQYHVAAAATSATRKQRDDQLKIAKNFDAQAKPLMDSLENLDSVSNLNDLKNPVADSAVRSNLVRAVGNEKGKIPIQEIMQYAGDPSAVNTFQRWLNKEISGEQFTPKDREAIVETINKVRGVKEGQIKDRLLQHAGRATMSGVTDTDEQALNLLVGSNPRLKAIAGLGQPAASGQQQPGQPQQQPQDQYTMMQDPQTGQLAKFWRNPSTGKYHKVTGPGSTATPQTPQSWQPSPTPAATPPPPSLTPSPSWTPAPQAAPTPKR